MRSESIFFVAIAPYDMLRKIPPSPPFFKGGTHLELQPRLAALTRARAFFNEGNGPLAFLPPFVKGGQGGFASGVTQANSVRHTR